MKLFTPADVGRPYIEPSRKYLGDAGFDVYSPFPFILRPGEVHHVPLNIRCALPRGWFAMLQGRSSQGLAGVFTIGNVIDEGYKGEIGVTLVNASPDFVQYLEEDRIAQIVLMPRYVMKGEAELPVRGRQGLGSTGK